MAGGMDEADFTTAIAPYRRELRAHCYRMSGSLLDADDLLQETLIKAWKGLPTFEGRSSLRTWLYTVATRACIDALEKKSARTLPRELGPPSDGQVGPPRMDVPWLEPAPSELMELEPSPEARYSQREGVALAFLVALQRLPPRQRAVLILRDVVGWQASECGELLGLSVAAVNSALQRARETLAAPATVTALDDPDKQSLLQRYVQAWERADVELLVSILHEDATLAMPPMAEWLQGARVIGASITAMVFSQPGAFTLVAAEANGLPAFGVYRDGKATGIHVVEISRGRIDAVTAFLNPALFAAFGLPPTR
jgi:RNA polymerase sigma-70 factor (ECF subfamily)